MRPLAPPRWVLAKRKAGFILSGAFRRKAERQSPGWG